MVGSGAFSVFLNKTSYRPGDTLQLSATVFAAATFVCSLSASPTASTGNKFICNVFVQLVLCPAIRLLNLIERQTVVPATMRRRHRLLHAV